MSAANEQHEDVIVVGAGVIGLTCAWRLAREGMAVRILDRETPAAGATGVAAGMLAPVGELSFGERRLLEMNLASARSYPEFVAELEAEAGVDAGYERGGALHVALDRDEAEALRRRHRHQLSLGLDARWLRPSECRELEPGLATGVAGGVHAPDEGAIDPAALVPALGEAARRAGVEIEQGVEATGVLADVESISGVRTGDGRELRASTVVVATGCWSGSAAWLPEAARPPVRPVKGQILTLRGKGPPVVERIVVTERIYAVPRPDGRLVVGATVEEMGFDTTVTAGGVHELLREAYRALPETAELELEDARAGLRPGTPDNLPLIGRGALRGLILATGHFRNGILLAPLTAHAVVALARGEEPDGPAAHADPARLRSRPRPTEVAAR